MYSGEYNVSDVTFECVSTPGRLKSLPDHGGGGGDPTRDIWDTTVVQCSAN